MSKSTAVEKAAPAGVPALASTPALDLDSSDVVLPRIRLGHKQDWWCGEGLAEQGDLYATSGKEDPNPQMLAKAEEKPGLLVHILSIKKGLSWTDENDELQSTYHGDPAAPPFAGTTYDYSVVLPEIDPDVPYKFLFKKSMLPAAKNINTVLLRNADRGPSYTLAFRITTAPRSTTKGSKTFTYSVPIARQEDAKDAHVQLASDLAGMIAGAAVEQTSGNNSAPAI